MTANVISFSFWGDGFHPIADNSMKHCGLLSKGIYLNYFHSGTCGVFRYRTGEESRHVHLT